VLDKLYQPRLLCIPLLTLIGSASLVDYASAQHSNAQLSSANKASSIVLVSEQSLAGPDGGLSGPPSSSNFVPLDRYQLPPVGTAAPKLVASPSYARAPGERTSLEMIAPQAQAHIDYALNLAERGAVQSAQAEFIMALDLIADALDADTENTTRAHARAIQAGLTAIEETRDFVPADTPHNVVINLAQLAATHQTPVLKNVDVTRITRAQALQLYHTYATQQLAFGGGRSDIASSALYGLGRAECVTTAGASGRNPLGGPNAMALYQSALLVDPQNYMASNELGVLMARYGDLDSAAGQLTHSLSVKPQAETWHNLATVYRRAGQTEKAEQSEREREKLLAAPRNEGSAAHDSTDLGARPSMQWVDAETFAATTTPYGLDGPAVTSNKSPAAAQHESLGKRLIAKLNPWPKTERPQQNAYMNQSSSKPELARNGESDSRTLLK
jgi:tetratricopeptide (TPR) repeat protein